MEKDIQKTYFSAEEIQSIVSRLGKQISEDYKDKNLLLVSILKGSVVFMADLMRSITIPCRTLLIAAGLRPERELVSTLGNPEWLHICGNCNVVHPMVEAVVQEGKQAGQAALKQMR